MMKRIAALAASLCLTLSALTASASASAYFPRYTGGSGSIAVALDAVGADASYANRSRIAAANGIGGYSGTAAQNTRMLELLKQGALADPAAADASSPFFPAYGGDEPSIVSALNALGIESSFSYRARIAAANGIADYSGTAAQNTGLLSLLRQGRLVRPGSAAAPAASGGLTAANLGRVSFLRQSQDTCKATSAAMAVNILAGGNRYSTQDMIYSGVLCRSLDGELFKGSDGNTYRAVYKTDGYVGSLEELKGAVDAALSDGLPAVAAVNSSVSRHHWIVVVGRDSRGDYLVVDPAGKGSGSMASQARSMSSMGYSFGLADYARPHYGYIIFQRR